MTQDNTPEVGTLRQLNVQPGDVVELVWGGSNKPGRCFGGVNGTYVSDLCGVHIPPHGWFTKSYDAEFRIISRAAPQSAATPATKWDAMTDAERVTAVYEGLKGAQRDVTGADRVKAVLANLGAIKPEPAVKEVALWIECEDSIGRRKIGTINLIDGKPDLASAVLS